MALTEMRVEAARLATMFCVQLRRELSAKQIKVAVERNRTPEYARACATHDFCDANMTMYRAHKAAFGVQPTIELDATQALWNLAWDYARAAEFNVFDAAQAHWLAALVDAGWEEVELVDGKHVVRHPDLIGDMGQVAVVPTWSRALHGCIEIGSGS